MTRIKYESRKGKKFVVVRDNRGRIIHSAKAVRGDKRELQSKADYFKRYGTFTKGYKEKREDLRNVTEVIRRYDKLPDKIPKDLINKKFLQVFAGTDDIGRDGLWARSNKRFDNGKTVQYQDMVNDAEQGFYKRLDQHFYKGYDADEGMQLVAQHNIKMRYGFVWYQINKKSFSSLQNRNSHRAR